MILHLYGLCKATYWLVGYFAVIHGFALSLFSFNTQVGILDAKALILAHKPPNLVH